MSELTFHSVVVQGFKSFKTEQTFRFPGRAGFYYMGGLNEAEPRSGANGTGKSTLWDAIIWCLTGRTSRGVRGPHVRSWDIGDGPCVVEVNVSTGRSTYTVTRTQSPISLTVSEGHTDDGRDTERPVTQEELDKLLGGNFEVYTSTVLMSQFGRYFFDLGPTEKLALFSGIFQLDRWLSAADRAKAIAKAAEAEAHKAESDIARTGGTIRAHKEHLRTLGASVLAWDQAAAAGNKARRSDLAQLKAAWDRARNELHHAEREHGKWTARFGDLRRQLIDADESLKLKIKPKFLRATDAYLHSDAAVSKIKAKIERAEQLNQATCPTCYAPVDTARVGRVIAKMRRNELAPAEAERAEAKAKMERLSKRCEEAEQLRRTVEAAYVGAEKRVQALQREVADLASVSRSKERQVRQAESDADKAKQQKNPHTDAYNATVLAIKGARRERDAAKERLGDATERKAKHAFWVPMFKEFRLWIIEQALLDFELAVNNVLTELGLPDWRVRFDVERETQAGNVSRGFTVLIQSPTSGGPVPWELWSGGETQRLRLAGAIGLSDLVRSQTGFQPSIEVWDEPTQHLSREGVEDMLRYFQARAREQGRQVWLVDHATQPGGEFDGGVVVVRDANGSRITDPTKSKKPKRETL